MLARLDTKKRGVGASNVIHYLNLIFDCVTLTTYIIITALQQELWRMNIGHLATLWLFYAKLDLSFDLNDRRLQLGGSVEEAVRVCIS